MLGIVRQDNEETTNGADRVFAFFRDRLLSGELKAGDRLLPERELSLSLGVSRPVLREALRSLAMLGLLDIQHGRGAFVRAADASVLGQALTLCLAPEPNVLDDVMQARIAIECQAIRLACQRASERDLQSISATLERLVDALSDPEAGGRTDYDFHSAIVKASGSVSLVKMYEAISPLLMQSHVERRRDTFREPAVTSHLVDAHREVFLSLARRDPDAAEKSLRDHFTIGDEVRRKTLLSAHVRRSFSMKLVVGSDHAGFPLKGELVAYIKSLGHEVEDVGSFDPNPVDFPDIARKVAGAITSGKAERGLMVCGTGVGAAIGANKMKGIRAAVCHDVHSAHQCVEHDDVNVMCIGAQIVGAWLAKDLIAAYLDAKFSTAEEFRRRVAKLADMDAGR